MPYIISRNIPAGYKRTGAVVRVRVRSRIERIRIRDTAVRVRVVVGTKEDTAPGGFLPKG